MGLRVMKKSSGMKGTASTLSNVRLYGFFDGEKKIVLTHGFKKHARGGKKVQTREREHAERIRQLLVASREEGSTR
jgi:hypothetical protein